MAKLTDRARNDLKCVEGRKTKIKPNQKKIARNVPLTIFKSNKNWSLLASQLNCLDDKMLLKCWCMCVKLIA